MREMTWVIGSGYASMLFRGFLGISQRSLMGTLQCNEYGEELSTLSEEDRNILLGAQKAVNSPVRKQI